MAEQEIITADGEVITTGLPAMIDDAMAGTLARAEIDMQIATAHKFPRSIKRAIDSIVSLATLDEETAEECIYALKRGGKPLRGPSIRLAEIIQQTWGNNRSGAVVTSIDRINKIIVAEGFFHDLETNSATRASVQRRISDKSGRIFNDDMIAVTGNAACSIAKRNAILAGVPKGVWRRAVDAAEDVIRGDVKTLAERRGRALAALAHYNLSAADVFAIMEVEGEDDLGIDDLVTLSAIRSNLKNGETTAEELLRGTKAAKPAHQVVENALSDVPTKAQAEAEAEVANLDARATAVQGDGEAAQVSANHAATGGTASGDDAALGSENAASSDATAAQTDADPIATARQRGEAARQKGMSRKAVPPEYREADRSAEAAAWVEGFDSAKSRAEEAKAAAKDGGS
ncbi:hypothetical protein [Kaistia sp. MMO-174]|uniref:hypothetical protein n=1 Tax=Kaistia sp. MMO-174 TaxID=3081256 RepID=UPI00301735E1